MKEIVNVIELSQGNLQKIKSWIVPVEFNNEETNAERANRVVEAEAHFVQCVRENVDGMKDESEDDILDSDNHTDGSGYEVMIVWSHEVIQ